MYRVVSSVFLPVEILRRETDRLVVKLLFDCPEYQKAEEKSDFMEELARN